MEQKLYEISNEILALEDLDLPEEQIKDTLEGLKGTFELKAESVGKFMRNLDSDIGAVDVEIKRLQARKKAMQNRKNSIREYLRLNMTQTGIKKISCPLFTITLAKGVPMAFVTDEESLPARYKEVVNTVKVNRLLLMQDLKKGEQIPGAELGTSATSVRIK